MSFPYPYLHPYKKAVIYLQNIHEKVTHILVNYRRQLLYAHCTDREVKVWGYWRYSLISVGGILN